MAKKKANKKNNVKLYAVVGGVLVAAIAGGIIIGVNAPKEVTFEEFQTAVEEIKAAPFTAVNVSGKYVDSDKANVSFTNYLEKKETKVLLVTVTAFTADDCNSYAYSYANTTVKTFAVAEVEDYTYYAGNWGFKVVGEDEENGTKVTYNFNDYGFITSVKGNDKNGNFSFNLSWKK